MGEERRCGAFTLMEPLGEGDSGTTWAARQVDDGSPAIVRIPLARFRPCFQRFLQELDVADRLAAEIPGVVGSRERGFARDVMPSVPYLVRAYIPGVDLMESLARAQIDGPRFIPIAYQLAKTLQAIHQRGVAHGNLHPRNVLLAPQGAGFRPHLTDLGTAQFMAAAEDIGIRAPRSWPACAFLAPEVYHEGCAPSAAADVFSLGALLYHAHTGEPPLRPLPAARPPAIPAELYPLMTRMMSPEPGARPSLSVVLDELHPRRLGGFLLGQKIGEDPRWVMYEAEREADQQAGCLRVYIDQSRRPGRSPLIAAQILESRRDLLGPHMARVLGSGVDDERAWVFLAPLPRDRVGDHRGPQRRLGVLGFSLALQLVEPLRILHQMGAQHLGLYPDAIALAPGREEVPSAILLDAETVCVQLPAASEFQRTIEIVALDQETAPVLYLPPEQRDGSGRLGPATDIYALGATLYFMLTGEAPLPGGGQTPVDLAARLRGPGEAVRLLRVRAPELPREAELLIGRMLRPDPQERPSLDEVEHQLRCLKLGCALLAAGELGPYRISSLLGFGGMSVVLRAERKDDRAHFALKVPLPTVPGERVQQEVDVMRALPAHPGLPRLIDVVPGLDGRPCLVMELLDGVIVGRGPLDHADVLSIGLQASEALCAAHARGVLHRDIKPDNLLRVGRQVKVIDFGVGRDTRAVKSGEPRRTEFGSRIGTQGYLGPEGEADRKADVYALGVTLWELSTGQHPRVHGAAQVADQELRDLLLRMQADRPEERPTMPEVARRLRGLRDRRPLSARAIAAAAATLLAASTAAAYALWPAQVQILVDQEEVQVFAGERWLGSAGPERPFQRRVRDLGGVESLVLKKAGYAAVTVTVDKTRSQRSEHALRPVRFYSGDSPRPNIALCVKPACKKRVSYPSGSTELLSYLPQLGLQLEPRRASDFVVLVRFWQPGYQEKVLQLDTTQDQSEVPILDPIELMLSSTPAGAALSCADAKGERTRIGDTPLRAKVADLLRCSELTLRLRGYQDYRLSVPKDPDSAVLISKTAELEPARRSDRAAGPPLDQGPLGVVVAGKTLPTGNHKEAR